ncbi:hypothetical protein ABGM91_01080 [Akkermansia muciniphila]|uniref:hypothetical protein n=1 Tax=Akkermansia muciniphila TaxID=239935 RepID=UPI0033BC39A8
MKNVKFIREPCSRILIGICSCLHANERQQAVRETWMKNLPWNIQCKIFVGGKYLYSFEKEHVVYLPVCDNYEHLPKKILTFFKYALLNYDFEWFFKCDDDTYVKTERLHSLLQPGADLIGNTSLQTQGYPSGGAGYFLSRSIIEKIVSFDNIPSKGFEDVIYGKLCQHFGGIIYSSERLCMTCVPYPMPDNNLASAHWCSPDNLRAIHLFNHSDPLITYTAEHLNWSQPDIIQLYPRNFFRRVSTGCAGIYHFFADSLKLDWFSWSSDILNKQGKQYRNDYLTLKTHEAD